MRDFFSIDGPFIEGMTKVADVFILNIIFIICSIPVFTIGASITAMYYVSLKMVKNEECYILKSFFKSFKLNFKQATVIWLLMLVVGTIILFDLRVMNGEYSDIIALSDLATKAMSILVMAAGILYSFTIVFVFPVLSRFDNTIKNTIKNALFMSIRHFPSTIAIILITFVPLAFMYIYPRALIFVFVIFGLCAYVNSFLFVKIFKNYMPEESIVSDSDFEVVFDNKKQEQ